MKIRTRPFMLGLLPTLLVAMLLTAYHVHTRTVELEASVTEQGMAMHLMSLAWLD